MQPSSRARGKVLSTLLLQLLLLLLLYVQPQLYLTLLVSIQFLYFLSFSAPLFVVVVGGFLSTTCECKEFGRFIYIK